MSSFSDLHILCVNSSFLPQLQTMATCHAVHLPAGVHSVLDFFPDTKIDVLIQEEILGKRVLLQHLDHLNCLRVFWARDPHLNAYWQTCYGRLFDLVCSTQKRWGNYFSQQGAANTAWLTWSGVNRPFVSWQKRTLNMAFVARVEKRPIRHFMCSFLRERFGLEHEEDLGREAMLERYAQAKIVPNEAILAEVNMRLFEGASCGCVVVGQKTDEDIEELFEPGREAFFFDHVLEMEEQIAWLLARPAEAEKIGRRAWKRVQACHLPLHRAQRMVDLILGAGKIRRAPLQGEIDFWLTLYALYQDGSFSFSADMLKRRLAGLKEKDPRILRAFIQHLYTTQCVGELEILLIQISQSGVWADNCLLYLTCSVAALLGLKRLDLARHFRQIHVRAQKQYRPVPEPETGIDLLLAWSTLLRQQSIVSRPGFSFDSTRHLPQTALEILLCAISLSEDPTRSVEQMKNLLRNRRGYDEFCLRHLSWLGLRRREDWRLGLELGLTNLRIFRKREGLEELAAALLAAQEQGQEKAFFRVLRGADPSGLVWRYLIRRGMYNGA